MPTLRILIVAILLSVVRVASAALVLYLPFDRDGSDASGAGRNATPHNGAGITRGEFRVGPGAATFNGQGAYYNIPIFNPVLENQPRSAAFWVRGHGPSMSAPSDLFLGWGEPGGGPRVRFDIGLEQTNDYRLRAEFNADAVVSTAASVNFLDGEWHHVLVTYDGKSLRFFVDGKSYGDGIIRTVPLATGSSVSGMAVGAGVREASGRWGDPKRCFNGLLDDVGIWDESLSATDAALLNGLARLGDNDLRLLPLARELWKEKSGQTLRIGSTTWKRVSGLPGRAGDWLQAGGPNGAGSFIVLSNEGEGLQISPRWWESATLRTGGLLLGSLALVLVAAWTFDRMNIRIRLRRLETAQKAEAERRRISQDLHDDLGARLTEIILLGEKAREGNVPSPEVQKHIATITDKAHAMVTALDEVVWTVNPENDSVPELADYLSGYTQEFLQNTGLRCRLEVTRGLPPAVLPAGQRRNIMSAVKEALNNAVRHSGGNEIWLRILRGDGALEISVEDNGRGLPAAADHAPGNGLANMRARIESIGGRFEISSQPGRGTVVRLKLPINEPN